jgi:hypothetical protein
MPKPWLTAALLLLAGGMTRGRARAECVPDAQRQTALAEPLQVFDQNSGNPDGPPTGWRVFSPGTKGPVPGCANSDVSKLIEDYVAANGGKLSPQDKNGLLLHAAQGYAYDGKVPAAVAALQKAAHDPGQPGWDQYVQATIDYLRASQNDDATRSDDKADLLRECSLLQGNPWQPVVSAMVKCFGQSLKAVGNQCKTALITDPSAACVSK